MSIFFPRHDAPDPDVLESLMWQELAKASLVRKGIVRTLADPIVSLEDARRCHVLLGELIGRWEAVERLREVRG